MCLRPKILMCGMLSGMKVLDDYLKPDIIHVLIGGQIVKTGGPELALEIDEKGFDWIKAEAGL